MKAFISITVYFFVMILMFSCDENANKENNKDHMKEQSIITAKDILGNPNYLAISFGGYRYKDHGIEPSIDQLKDDMKLLAAMGVKIVRTYKVHLPEASNLLKAISELKQKDPTFEMYVMLGAWIDCKNAWTDQEPDHNEESEANASQMLVAVYLANEYPDIVKILAVGNEAMVKWAPYHVRPGIVLKWVNHLQDLKKTGKLPKEIYITSSDNFASWGGGGPEYHVEDLEKLYRAVDYVSMHTYPVLDSHYNPDFWGVPDEEKDLPELEKIDKAMLRARDFAKSQYNNVSNYMKSLGIKKPIHIGETGWTTVSDDYFGPNGSKAADEYKQSIYYKHMRDWTNKEGISCFYFEAFNEPWKDAASENGSENHFGLFNVDGQAKYALWELVDKGTFEGLTRNGNTITKTYNGDKEALIKEVLVPPTAKEIAQKSKE